MAAATIKSHGSEESKQMGILKGISFKSDK